ncbi:tol-pal system protein YbgF [Endozoicomonas sp. (ex Bugula neritina AB1)]|nr:tol-pal system protein YbgF [Endozoicomonas sp. (ex Bugula neritina AB1)]
MGMNIAKLNSITRQWIGTSALMLALTVPAYGATVPVVDSQPFDRNTSAGVVSPKTVSQSEVNSSRTDAAQTSTDATGTAYLLNTIDQMRQEIMELRGQLEEHQFQIDQIRRESRDRYIDLDERIARLSSGGKSPEVAVVSTATVTPTVAPPVETSSESKDAKAQADEQQAYQKAFQLIRDRQFDEAQVALKKQLDMYPQGKYADNARYWLGEVQMAQGKYSDAKDTFLQVLKDYPSSLKVADATYKLGRIYDLLGERANARDTLQSVLKNYPDTAAARLSDTYLRSMPGS